MDRSRDLLLRQVEFQGMGGRTAAFVVTGAVRSLLMAFAAAIPVGGGKGSGACGAMAYDGEVGREDNQQR
jgi:hypothetical protein